MISLTNKRNLEVKINYIFHLLYIRSDIVYHCSLLFRPHYYWKKQQH